MNYANVPVTSQGTVPPPSAPGVSGILPGQSAVNTTRILSLTGFSKELKTRDIQNIFVDYEDDRGGYRIKWLDDTGCLIVFSDPLTAKRAFLQLLASPHPHLIPSTSADGEPVVPLLRPYLSEDVSSIIASVANRPRSRSIASNVNNNPSTSSPGGPGHGRRLSSSSHAHARGGSLASGGPNGERRPYGGRQSFSQGQMQAIMDEASHNPSSQNESAVSDARAPSPQNTLSGNAAAAAGSNGGAIDWSSMTQNISSSSNSSPSRLRTISGAAGAGAGGYSPPVSPERGMRAGATSPSTLRRLVQQRG